MEKISVCIPTHNRATYIGETITSVLASTYQNLEIIVSDNASTDNTREIVEAFDDDRIHFYRNTSNLGPVKNWNCALERASGEFVGVLFSDDLYGPFWLVFAAHVLTKHPHISWVGSAFRIINDKGRILSIQSRFPNTRECTRSEAFLCFATLRGLGPAYIARREILEEVGFYDESAGLFADNDLFLRLAAKYPLYYSSNPHHAAYRVHNGNMAHQWKYTQQIHEGLRMLRKVFSDETLPAELHVYERISYTHVYRDVLSGTEKLLAKGDIETAQQLIDLLAQEGFGNHRLTAVKGNPNQATPFPASRRLRI